MTTFASRLLTTVLVLVVGIGALIVAAQPAQSWVSGSQWDPGYIISDAQFYNGSAMTEAEIQAFLNAKVPRCEPERSMGPHDPIVCLKDYRENTITRPADAYCTETYQGASNETAARIIYKVAQACNISPKVLLVTLQKEQGLVTHTWPSQYRYDKAMGFGCPDNGSGCQAEYFGFQNQVWRAARQFQRYRLLPTSYNYRAGVTNLIAYNPNTACGYQSVFIRNAATAGLYNYTPYVPNQAALNAIPGEGNSCSSYGNRNFWMYYWEWFGSPYSVDGRALINAEYERTGGASGPLGTSLATRQCASNASRCWQDYEGGLIGWSQAGGAFTVLKGDIYDAYMASGGPSGWWGMPTSTDDPFEWSGGPAHRQNFEYAQAVANSTGAYGIPRLLLGEYANRGWVRGELGWPTAAAKCTGNVCAQDYANGVLASYAGELIPVTGSYLSAYRQAGGVWGSWGAPISTVAAVSSPNGNGSRQNFENAQALQGPSGVFAVPNSLLGEYGRLDWVRGPLGWPVGQATCVAGECAQDFQGGVLAQSGGKFYRVASPFIAAYRAAGGPSGSWGFPISTSDPFTSVNGSGYRQNFKNGQALSSSSGTFLVPNVLMTKYGEADWIRGPLGWPTATADCTDAGSCSQQFQGGKITVGTGGTGGTVSDGDAIASAYAASGGASGPWGKPISSVDPFTSVNGSGFRQNYENGQALSSAAGAFLVPNKLMSTYGAVDWIRGPLGWPTAAAVCPANGACMQQFQGGFIIVPAGSTAGYTMLNGPITTAYQANGGPSGPWGAPTSGVAAYSTVNGAGTRQNFASGQVLSSASGVFLVPNKLMTAYGQVDWIRGPLGYPTADASCPSNGVCSQQFQGGVIIAPAGSTSAYALTAGPITTAYLGSGGPSGPWGAPISDVAAYTTVNGSGSRQNFVNGQALASSAGVYLVPNKLMTAYGQVDWIRGPLGYPTADASCPSNGVCSQQFQGGVIIAPAGSTSAYALTAGPITTAYLGSGGPSGPWGAPISDVAAYTTVNGSGSRQNFVNGQALASSAGVYLVPNKLMTAYGQMDWIRGPLGYPIAQAVCPASGTCSQTFQGGTIALPAGATMATVTLNKK